jgi:hypothetical protein
MLISQLQVALPDRIIETELREAAAAPRAGTFGLVASSSNGSPGARRER